ncbi:MAG: amidohydrolase [Flavipsychrobacter sp.]|nr:amidohydrolase [Flavipsychrobacter sp.]
MASDQLHITVIQPDIVWENKEANLLQYEKTISGISGPKHVVALPEMFSTGFSMAPERLAEPMDGTSVRWMADMAVKYRCILTGSLIIEEDGKYYNRMLWVQPDGKIGVYDKRHLFGYADEDKHYTKGETKLIAQVNGWRINLMVCYDLRFPVWSRNTGDDYDVLLYVANWPEVRSLAWKTLLQARAIENMSYVVGVNRVGKDGKDYNYSGDSSVFGPLGEQIWQQSNDVACHTVTLEKDLLLKTRSKLPFLQDADKFLLL